MTELVRPATCRRFEPGVGGEVVLDDSRCLPFDDAALAGSGFRLLRPGQRVRVTVLGDPGEPGARVTAIRLP